MTAADRAARRVLLGLLGRLTGGRVTLIEGGRTQRLGDGVPAAGGDPLEATLEVRDPRLWRRVARERSIGLGLAYADGWWTTDDLPALLRLLGRNARRADGVLLPLGRLNARLTDPVRRRRRVADHTRDRHNIRAHYDIGDEVFALFLDESRLYSCAIFDDPAATLAEAQRAKLERICAQLRLGPDDHLLEIGTGWGGLAIHAARHHGCRVTTTTISDRQFAHARRWVAQSGLEDRVTVLHEHYRDLRGTFDRLVSVEMIEAVDWREYDDFFGACGRLVRPGGRMLLQAITIPDERFERAKNSADFIKAVIFPGGCLPSVEEILRTTARVSDLRLLDRRELGPDYAETLRRWRVALLDRAGELPALGLDEGFARTFEFYFAYCEAGFDERMIGDVQLTFDRPGG